VFVLSPIWLTTSLGAEAKSRQKNTAGSEQWTAEQKAQHALQKSRAQHSSAETDEVVDRGQRRADARTAAKLAWAEESEGVAEILKEEGLLDVDAMQQLDVLVRKSSIVLCTVLGFSSPLIRDVCCPC
jgi:hypothetical protein